MEQFVEKLQEEVELYLQKHGGRLNDNPARTKNGILLLEDIFRRLKSFVVEKYEFKMYMIF